MAWFDGRRRNNGGGKHAGICGELDWKFKRTAGPIYKGVLLHSIEHWRVHD